MEAIDPQGEILSVAARGYGKRTPVDFYRQQSRGGLGIINLKVSDKTGEVVGAKHVTPGEGLMLITQEGMIIRMGIGGIRIVGRSTQGVKLMDLEGGDRLVAVAKLAEREENELAAGELDEADGDGGAEGDEGLDLAAGDLAAEDAELAEDEDVDGGEPEEPIN
jgi:DNA gyrase subunit A